MNVIKTYSSQKLIDSIRDLEYMLYSRNRTTDEETRFLANGSLSMYRKELKARI